MGFDLFSFKKLTPEEQKRRQKCKEIKSYIEHLNKCKPNHEWIEHKNEIPDFIKEYLRQNLRTGGKVVHFISNYMIETVTIEQGFDEIKIFIRDYHYQEIEKYKGWLHWWQNTSIENIIREKGENYNSW